MKPIKIKAENAEKIEAALKEVNGQARSYAITHVGGVERAAEIAERMLEEAGLPKSERKGAKFSFAPAGPRANSYKYNTISTAMNMERRATGWFLTVVDRCHLSPKEPETKQLYITEAQAEEIKRRAVQHYCVMKSADDPAWI